MKATITTIETFAAKRVGNVLVTAPIYSSAHGHKVWAAILFDQGPRARLVGRIFLGAADGGLYSMGEMREGDWVEFAADIPYFKNGYEAKQRRRWVGKVIKMTENEVVFAKHGGVLSDRYEELFQEE